MEKELCYKYKEKTIRIHNIIFNQIISQSKPKSESVYLLKNNKLNINISEYLYEKF